MEKEKQLVRFDWAIKRLLRHKADHTILNGFLSSLLGRKIRIVQMLESESNRETDENKSNRVDMLAQEEDGTYIIIEVQNETETSYLHRILFGTSKVITEYLKSGENYDRIKKVYSVNIVYFRIDEGDDFAYRGKTEFRGIHNNELLVLPQYIKGRYGVEEVNDIFPEYYILKANNFNKVATSPLEEWMHFLSHSEIPEGATAPGLKEAAEELQFLKLTPEQRREYERYRDAMLSIESQIDSALYIGRFEGKMEGLAEGREKGLAEGREKGLAEGREKGMEEGRKEEKIAMALKAKEMGLSLPQIAELTGMNIAELQQVLK